MTSCSSSMNGNKNWWAWKPYGSHNRKFGKRYAKWSWSLDYHPLFSSKLLGKHGYRRLWNSDPKTSKDQTDFSFLLHSNFRTKQMRSFSTLDSYIFLAQKVRNFEQFSNASFFCKVSLATTQPWFFFATLSLLQFEVWWWWWNLSPKRLFVDWEITVI